MDPSGLWSEFDTPAGASNEWATGFVAATIRGAPGADRLTGRAARGLLARPRSGGWGYSEGLPIDCDSTAWVLLALGAGGARPLIVRRALDAVLAHQVEGAGGFSTYAARAEVQALIDRAGDQRGSAGWLVPQPCVTAVALAALLLHGEPVRSPRVVAGLEFLLSARRDDVWRSYWWPGELYATYHALRVCLWAGALGQQAVPADRRRRAGAPPRRGLDARRGRLGGRFPDGARNAHPPPRPREQACADRGWERRSLAGREPFYGAGVAPVGPPSNPRIGSRLDRREDGRTWSLHHSHRHQSACGRPASGRADSFVTHELILRLIAAAVLLTAVVAKLAIGSRERAAAVRGLAPAFARWADAVATVLLLAEAAAVALLLSPLYRLGGLATAALGLAFAFVVGRRLAAGQLVPCGCMGRLKTMSVGPGLLTFDLALAGIGLAVALGSSPVESGVIAMAVVVAGLAAQASWVAVTAKRRAAS